MARLLPLFAALALASCSSAAPSWVEAQPKVPPPPAKVSKGPPAPAAPPKPEFVAPADLRWVRGVWSDGADGLVLASDDHIHRLERGGASLAGRGPDNARATCFGGAGADRQTLVVGAKGELASLSGGRWQFGLAPALDGEDLAGCGIDSKGRWLVVGAHRAIYIRQGDTWTVVRYPAPPKVVHAAVGPGDEVYVVGANQRVLVLRNNAFTELALSSLTAEALAPAWVGAWLSSDGKRLWVVAHPWLLGIDTTTGSAAAEKLPFFFDTATISGARTTAGDLLLLSTFGEAAIYDGRTFTAVEGKLSSRTGLALDVRGAMLYAADSSGLASAPVKHPFLGNGPAPPFRR